MSCEINQVNFVGKATPALNTFSFQWGQNRQPIELTMHVTRVDGVYDSIYAVPSWNLVGTSIQINGIQGLTNGVTYKIITVVK